MACTYAELGATPKVQTNFEAAVAAVPDGSPENRAKLIRYIERHGKGRFAQRLAAHLDGVDPPDYIVHALSHLRDELA
jgi:putative ATP-dependent endonuclease of OLD family